MGCTNSRVGALLSLYLDQTEEPTKEEAKLILNDVIRMEKERIEKEFKHEKPEQTNHIIKLIQTI